MRIVIVDETYIISRKYHRGRMLYSGSVWVFGAICRSDKNDCLRIVRNPKQKCLKPSFAEYPFWKHRNNCHVARL
jgi:hypothetical protein